MLLHYLFVCVLRLEEKLNLKGFEKFGLEENKKVYKKIQKKIKLRLDLLERKF